MNDPEWWQDALDEPLPPELTARSLDAMRAEARRRRQQQRRRRVVGGAAILAATVLLAQVRWQPQPKAKRLSPLVAVLPVKPLPAPSPAPAGVASVRYIDDKELAARLGDVGVVTVGSGASRRVLLVAADGRVYPP